MNARDFDPLHLDVTAFAKAGEQLGGAWPLQELPRLTGSTAQEHAPHDTPPVAWRASGELRVVRGEPAQVWLHLEGSAALSLECQRCLQAVAVPLQIERHFLFVHGEDAAAQLDAETDDDVLALTRSLDLRELVEDELLLALPLVPKHEICPIPLPLPTPVDEDPLEHRPNPFEALKHLGKLN